MKNVTEIRTTLLSQNGVVLLLCVSMIPNIVNVVYVIVCFKTLKKKLHNLLVLSLCVSDGFLGFSLTWYLVTKLSDFLRTSVTACLLQYFFVSYGLVSTYSLVMVISLERYAVVKSLNFGVNQTLNRFKYLIIFGTLAFGLLFTLETVLFTPHQATIKRCNLYTLYGEDFGLFVTFMAGYVSTLMGITVVVSSLTGYHIWRLFFRKKNNVHRRGNSFEIGSMENSIDCDENTSGTVTAADCSHRASISRNYETKNDDEAGLDDEKENSGNTKVRALIEIFRSIRIKDEPNVEQNQPRRVRQRMKKIAFDSWEVRAFTTSVIIALTTITLTGPLIISYWFDNFCGFCLAHVKMYFLIPLEINSILNPFIYAWRVPEIRQEFKKFFSHLKKLFIRSE